MNDTSYLWLFNRKHDSEHVCTDKIIKLMAHLWLYKFFYYVKTQGHSNSLRPSDAYMRR